MKLQGAHHTVGDIKQLRDDCLNPLHPRGRHKARVVASALRLVQADAEFLKVRLLDAVLEYNTVPGEMDEYGDRYLVDFECVKGEGRALLRSGWVPAQGSEPCSSH